MLGVTLYDTLKFFHILMAIIWVGGALVTQIYAVRVTRDDDPEKLAYFAKQVEWVGTRVFIPASLVLVVLGVWMVVIGPWSFGQAWVLFAIAVFAGSFLSGSLFLGPESGRIAKVLEERGPADPDYGRRLKRIFLVSRIELVALILVVFDMATKPFLG